MKGLSAFACVASLAAALAVTSAAAQPPPARSWAAPQIETVVATGLMGPSAAAFRPDDPLTASELATIVASFGVEVAVTDPARPVTMRELDAQLVTAAGLRPSAGSLRLAVLGAGLMPRPWLGTETIARMLGFRVNHQRDQEELELQLSQPATRAEAAYSVARVLALTEYEIDSVRLAVESFYLPQLDVWQQNVLRRALRHVGSPYVFAGTSERPQQLFGKTLPGGFDCSGFVWRVYKLEPFAGAPWLASVLKGRTTYDMSGEVGPGARITREDLQPGDVVFFGSRGPRSKPSEVGHMGIYVGGGWMVHSSDRGTTLTPMTGWYETRFAWARRPLAEARLSA
jgi:cell wall-associated NlpC family hydrolase